MPLFEYRRYEAVPGKLPALHRRFETTTLGFFKKHGIGVVGFWDAVTGTSNELHYILRFDDMAHREKAWGAFQADEGWTRARAETEKDGPLVARVFNQFWHATSYSPLK
ncbi:MAG: NIPSNAP family protein [Chloroflexi bacterium]|nr:NIPSNAP family protein [Chloroflexota bacterium]MBV9601788.1 NIPSNAP family protein [Chloroflexota bacterium]